MGDVGTGYRTTPVLDDLFLYFPVYHCGHLVTARLYKELAPAISVRGTGSESRLCGEVEISFSRPKSRASEAAALSAC
jgi:hypothetical protein